MAQLGDSDSSGLTTGAAASLQDGNVEVADSVPFSTGLPTGAFSASAPNSGSFSADSLTVEKDPELVHPDTKFECPVHKGLLQNPYQTSCGHRICRSCVDKHLEGAESKLCPGGEEECEKVSLNNIYPDPGFGREIKEALVYCNNKKNGCNEQVKLKNLKAHLKICEYRETMCHFAERGCTQVVLERNIEKHKRKCSYRPITCDLCNLEFSAKDKQEHDSTICAEAVVACPFKCGEQNIKRRQLEEHKQQCKKKPSECLFKPIGCTFSGDKVSVKGHESNVQHHLGLLSQHVTENVQRLEIMISALQQGYNTLKTGLLRCETQVKNNHKELRLVIVDQAQRLIETEQKNAEITRELNAVKEEQNAIKQSIDQLKALIPQMAGHDRQIAAHEIRMAEMDLRFQMIETASYDGKLLWKIRDFSQRRRDAVQGRTVSLYSQPFYTSRFGYKMCARVYLNGDGIGRNSHMSLYFVVMRGEYDALQAWPFQHKVSLTLLDQSPEKRHLKDEFFPDPNSTSFRRPVNAEMNVASGCPLFVAHSVLDNPTNQYVKDDTLFIMVKVDVSQLQPA